MQTICEADGSFRGGTWSREDVILFGSTPGPVYRVSASGGVPQGVTTLGSKRHDLMHRWPSFLPDGKHFFYLASQAATVREDDAVFVSSLDGKEEKTLLHTSSPVAYANGYLFYLSNQTLMARPFDPEKIEFTGNAVSVAEGVLIDPYFGGAAFSVSKNGVLLYQLGAPFSGYSLTLVDRDGKELNALRDPGMYFFPRISPDGKRVAYHSPDLQGGNTDVWVWDIATGNRKRLSFNPASNRTPVWSPDGMRIAYISSESGRNTVYLKPVDTMGAEEKSAELPTGVPSLTQWTPDGKALLFDDTAWETRQLRIDVVPVSGSGAVVPLMESTSSNIGAGTVSADGRWLAYRSTETGKGEVYITSFPKPSGKLQVSVSGGGGPRWRADGKELFYLGADRKLMMVAELKESGGSLQVASVHALFQAPMMSTRRNAHYDVTADGTKFVLQRVTGDETSAPLNIVVNWPTELKTK